MSSISEVKSYLTKRAAELQAIRSNRDPFRLSFATREEEEEDGRQVAAQEARYDEVMMALEALDRACIHKF